MFFFFRTTPKFPLTQFRRLFVLTIESLKPTHTLDLYTIYRDKFSESRKKNIKRFYVKCQKAHVQNTNKTIYIGTLKTNTYTKIDDNIKLVSKFKSNNHIS